MESDCCQSQPVVYSCCSTGSVAEPGIASDLDAVGDIAWRLGISLVLVGQSMIFGLGINITPPDFASGAYFFVHFGLFMSAIIVFSLLGGSLVKETIKCIKLKRFSLEGLFMLSIIGALGGSLISTITGRAEVYYEVVSIVLVIYTVGKTLGMRSRFQAIKAANEVRENFDFAYILDENGERKKVQLDELNCCSMVSVGPGDAVSVDGIITAGEGFVKETAMTGELEPSLHGPGDLLLAGSYAVDGTFTIKPTALKGDRRLDALLFTVENARLAPSALQQQADRIMQWFLPFVLLVCFGTFIYWINRGPWVSALFNSMAVLLVACPCALGLATPIAVWSGLWKLSTIGLVSRSGDFLDTLARANAIVFDKTGTLSERELVFHSFKKMPGLAVSEDFLKSMIHTVEVKIGHPVARALSKLSYSSMNVFKVLSAKVIPGKGIEAKVKDIKTDSVFILHLGELSLMPTSFEHNYDKRVSSAKKTIYISLDNKPAAIVLLEEKMRDDLNAVFKKIQALGLKTTILTGDSSMKLSSLEGVSLEVGLTPQEKEQRVRLLEDSGQTVIFVGDGVNDAAAMSICSASIAMDGGAVLTQSTASAVLMGNSLEVLPQAIAVCRRIRKNVQGNMIFATTYNIIGMSLAAVGILHPIVAALLMLISSVLVSTRAFRAANI